MGHAEDLARRLGEYRNATDDLGEHYRRHLIIKARGATAFYITDAGMTSKSKRLALEQAVIAELNESGINLINRGVKRSKDYFAFKIQFLEDQLRAARLAYEAAE